MYNRKEHYIISINNAIKTINKYIKLTKSKKISEDKYFLDMIKQNELTSNIKEYGMEILFDSNEELYNSNVLLGGDNEKILNYDDIILVKKFHKIIFNLFE